MNCSSEDVVKPWKIFSEKYLGLINAFEVYKYYLDEGQKISYSLCKYGGVIWELTVHKSVTKR